MLAIYVRDVWNMDQDVQKIVVPIQVLTGLASTRKLEGVWGGVMTEVWSSVGKDLCDEPGEYLHWIVEGFILFGKSESTIILSLTAYCPIFSPLHISVPKSTPTLPRLLLTANTFLLLLVLSQPSINTIVIGAAKKFYEWFDEVKEGLWGTDEVDEIVALGKKTLVGL